MNGRTESPPAFSADFIISAAAPKQFPKEPLPELALLGRSNAGKSSLMNRWLARKALARVGRTPGRTRQINFFKVAWFKDSPPFHLADLPGYGFAAAPKDMVAGWRDLVNAYLESGRPIRRALLLMDVRRDLADEEKNLLDWLEHLNIPAWLILTKADKLSPNQRAGRAAAIVKAVGRPLEKPPLLFSSLDGLGREQLITTLLEELAQ